MVGSAEGVGLMRHMEHKGSGHMGVDVRCGTGLSSGFRA